jgi:Xaa-Pro aminopeptidase
VLHYVDASDRLRAGELCLIDAGCELDGFTADVTRTFPIGARFSTAQRRVYELVLATEKACIDAVKPGATVDGIHTLAVERLTAGMVELGLLRGEVPALIESGAYKKYYMHRTSHWLGLDVHDVGAYSVDGKPRPLEPGMVLTIEPGLYISVGADEAPAEFRGIGVRIEDDILVTPEGPENLTSAIPKEVAEVEALAC